MPVPLRSRIAKQSLLLPKARENSSARAVDRGQYGHALITMEPNEPRKKGIEIENKIVGGTIPKEYIPAVIDGVNEALSGWTAGWICCRGCEGQCC